MQLLVSNDFHEKPESVFEPEETGNSIPGMNSDELEDGMSKLYWMVN